ncbi:hypothetical protein LMG28614_03639 [Paraburkholderia ultramafica]|uniref:Enoyl-CoA hydratase n=1 Tax=Paraburkholderia ultramafica TaxID=1544867 RepID=A0A6S7BRT0_9BURK|nr:hypothetical protein [Paraburkholderia ultramafica]CAB3793060.1 hypothetical protein LMG28614_03639 [Paraburkholderia ultramafica]
MNEPILAHRDGAVQMLSFNNPAARNALTPEVYKALPAARDHADQVLVPSRR